MARWVAGALSHPARVVDLPGRGGSNAWEALHELHGRPDVVAVTSPTLITNRLLGESPIDDRDLNPLAILYVEPTLGLMRAADGPAGVDSIRDGLSRGDTVVSFATSIGSVNHLILVAMCRSMGIEVEDVPIVVRDSARHAIVDLVEGNAGLALVSAASALAEIGSGALLPLLAFAPARLGGGLAGVPTAAEQGIECDLGLWRGLASPPGVSGPTAALWSGRIREVVSAPSWGDLLLRQHLADSFLEGEGCLEFLEAQRSALGGLLGEAGLAHV